MKVKSKKSKRYLPIYADGGGFGQWYQNNYQNVGTASAGNFAAKGMATDDPGMKGYNAGMGTISKAGPVGSAIGGITSIGDTVGDPIRKKAEAVDPLTGEYKDFQKAERTATVGSFLNPFKSGMTSLNDPDASTGEKALAFIGGPKGQRMRLERLQDKHVREVQEANKADFGQRRLMEESFNSPMQFQDGGYLGIPTNSPTYDYRTGQNLPKTYNLSPEEFRGASEGQVVSSQNLFTPGTKDLIGYKQYVKGESNPTYRMINSDSANTTLGGRRLMPGTEVPTFENGGYLEESRNNDDITYYANGGTHGENPNGGIPIGNKGLVEEGEFRYKDYIFTNRY